MLMTPRLLSLGFIACLALPAESAAALVETRHALERQPVLTAALAPLTLREAAAV